MEGVPFGAGQSGRFAEADAVKITLQVHVEGAGIAGVYSHEVAEQKGIEGTLLAREHGWPLALKIEEE